MRASFVRILYALALLVFVITIGGLGFHTLGKGLWSLGDSIYFAIITVSTVGFGELQDLEQVHGARALTVTLILLGSASLVFFQSNLTATLVEGALGQVFRRKRMNKQISALRGHTVICGLGSTGKYVVEELWAIKRPFVAIDINVDHLERVSRELCGGKMLYVHGDAIEDHVLIEAGVKHADGVVAALTSDRENLYVTLSARSLNPDARIVAKVVEAEADKKMRIAGASATVSPNIIGGRRLASEVVRPAVVLFLDKMMGDKEQNLRFEEVTIPKGSGYVGKLLRTVPFRKEANVLVVAIRNPAGEFLYNPGPDYVLCENEVLILIGAVDGVKRLKEMMSSSIPAWIANDQPPTSQLMR